jgi:hypothetical protein
LRPIQETLTARLMHSVPNSPIIADAHDSIACAYTEISDASKAFAYLDKAETIRLAKRPDLPYVKSAIGGVDNSLEGLQVWLYSAKKMQTALSLSRH